jgi:hypothetical protein
MQSGPDDRDLAATFIDAALSDLRRAEEMLAAQPRIAGAGLHIALVLGDWERVERALTETPALAGVGGGPRDWQPLLYVCFSRFASPVSSRSAGIAETARSLLRHGADPNAAYIPEDLPDNPLSCLYAASGLNNNPALTQALLEAGANPNDGESLYHSTEHRDLACMKLLLRHGATPVHSHREGDNRIDRGGPPRGDVTSQAAQFLRVARAATLPPSASVAGSAGRTPYSKPAMNRVSARAATRPPAKTDRGQPHTLAQDQSDDLAGGRSQGDADAEFMGAPGHRIRHDAVDSDRGQQQGGRREDDEHQHGEAALGERSRNDLLHRADRVDGLILGGTGDLRAHGGDQAQGLGSGAQQQRQSRHARGHEFIGHLQEGK